MTEVDPIHLTILPEPGCAIGIITPSANVVVERIAIDFMRAFPRVGLHFSRTPVFGEVDPYPDDYDWDAMLAAAELLAHAEPGVVVWGGSKGVLLGIHKDHMLCKRIETKTGIRSTSSSLALAELIERKGLQRIGLVTPYSDAYQQRLVQGFARLGIDCVAEAHVGCTDNLAYASVGENEIKRMTREVVQAAGNQRLDAVLAWCTNLPAASLAGEMENETGTPFYDATALALWHALRILDIDLSPARSWGSIFQH